ncbi:methyl-accepting chemotaxis protein [Kaarinaea lacus]
MNIQAISLIFCKFSIRQKLWGGFALLLMVLVVVAWNTLSSLSATKEKVDDVTQDLQPALIAAMQLRNELKETTTSLGFFLLTKEKDHQQSYQQSLAKLDESNAHLNSLPILKDNPSMANLLSAIEKDITRFKTYEKRMLHLAGSLTDNFSALGYSGTNINPLTREILQSLSNMILSETEEEASSKRKQLLIAIGELRYTWTSVVNNLRIYLFYGNEDALSNVRLFYQGAKDLVKKIENIGVELTFEQEEGLAVLSDAINKVEQHINVVVDIHHGDKARVDAFLVKAEITPILNAIDGNLQNLVDELRQSTNNTGEVLKQQAESTIGIVTTLVVAGLGMGIFLSWMMTMVITRPIRNAAQAMEDISEGEGDLTQRLAVQGSDEISEMATGFNRFVEKIQLLIKQVSESVAHLNTAAVDMSQMTKETNTTISKQKEETTQIATAVCEMSATAKEVAQNAELASEAAQLADKDTNHSREVVVNAITGIGALGEDIQHTADVIQKLGNDVENIGEVISVIHSVTEQTNLLALNAAIEAARAGEQGRGFAVVADEVRTLADRTKDSTNQIREKVELLLTDAKVAVESMHNNRDKAQQVISLAHSAGDSLNAVTEAVTNIKDMTYQIACAAEEQSQVAEEVNRNIDNVTQLANAADNAAGHVSNSTSDLQQLSQSLHALVARFKV